MCIVIYCGYFNPKLLWAMSIALKLKGVPRIVDTVVAQN